MIIEPGGGKGGLKNYLENGQKKGRELHRNQLDERIPLIGDLDIFELVTSSHIHTHEVNGQLYYHITLSWDENHVSNEMLQKAANEFLDHVLAAWPLSERDRIAVYAEAHRPRTLAYKNSLNGKEVKRYTHLHFAIGSHDLKTGEFIEPLGFLGNESGNLKYIDAWQESFNSRHGFNSPKDNPKITPENAIDVLARYTGSKPDALGTFNEQKANLEVILQKEILASDITTWGDFSNLLAQHGEVSVMNEGKFNECYRIKPTGAGRAMRLKGVFFSRQFIEKPTTEKLAIVQKKARVAYLEQMQPRKEPAYIAAVLDEWNTLKAKEHRFIHTGSSFYKEVYLPADAETRLQLLDQLERNHHAKPSIVANNRRKEIATARSRVPGLPSRNMAGIQKRSEMLLRGHSDVDVDAGPEDTRGDLGVRQADGAAGRRAGDRAPSAGSKNHQAGFGSQQSTANSQSRGAGQFVEIQPSSVIARLQFELRDRYQQAAEKDKYSEIRKNLDCSQLLTRLSHSHSLNPELYQITTAKDGTPRIQCGSRALSPSDFLMKELGLAWKDAAPILRQTYQAQIGGKVIKPRFDKSAPAKLWKDFKAEQEPTKNELSKRLKAFDGAAKSRRTAMYDRLKADQKTALSPLFGDARKAAHALEKLRAATVKAEFNAMLKEERQALRESIQPKNGWQLYLQKMAQEGNDEALIELRKLDDTARAKQVETPAITGLLVLNDEEEKKRLRRLRESSASILKSLAHTVQKNGDVTYHQHGHAVLRDEGQHLAVLDENNEEAIAAGLMIAREKFGTSLTLTGPADFQRRAVAVAVSQGIAVKFVDPSLEALRLKLAEEKRRPAPTPITQSERKERSTRAVAPVQEVPVPVAVEEPQPEVVAAPALLSAAEFIASQDKPAGPAYDTGDGKLAFVVLHVADSSIVIDHGKTVAEYPIQPGLVLQVGQRVVITKGGAIAPAPEQAKTGKGRAD